MTYLIYLSDVYRDLSDLSVRRVKHRIHLYIPGIRITQALEQSPINTVFAIYQIMLGWKTHKDYHETDELPKTKADPTQKGKIRCKVDLGHFFPTAKYFFVGWDWFYVGNRLEETYTNQIIRKHPRLITTHLQETEDDAAVTAAEPVYE